MNYSSILGWVKTYLGRYAHHTAKHAAKVARGTSTTERIILSTLATLVLLGTVFASSEPKATASTTPNPVSPPAHVSTANPPAKKPPVLKKKAAVKKAPPLKELIRRKITAKQYTYQPNKWQAANAERIIKTGEKMGLHPRAWVIALATACQEGHLKNYTRAVDHDSLGLFQQRPSTGWGKPSDLVKPEYAAKKFYQALVDIPGWHRKTLTAAAQQVQGSAFPGAYAKWEEQAIDLVLKHYGEGPLAH